VESREEVKELILIRTMAVEAVDREKIVQDREEMNLLDREVVLDINKNKGNLQWLK
jgi:hypothetical protein